MRLRASRTFLVEPLLPPPLEPLKPLVRNLYWTWDTDAVALFERFGRERWERSGHNPIRLLQMTSRAQLEELAGDAGFLAHLARVREAFEGYLGRPPQLEVEGTSGREVVAYFSLEFALTESLPVYSGGLGVLAGDHLKSASDLGLPLVGVGLLYRRGYFRQVLGPDGWQREEYDEIDLASQPLQRQLDDAGQAVTVVVPFEGRQVAAAVWRLDVGQTPLYLLDTDIEPNSGADRAIAAQLYGGDIETRIQQEMLLGIGGVRALHALGMRPAVCHMNEGHSALLGVERIRMLMEETGLSFSEALLPVSAATVFTTHTAVAAGIDLFPPELVRRHLSQYYGGMGLSDREFLGFGRMNPNDDMEPFSMALLGLRLSGYRNGVSKLHRTVSRKLWEGAWSQLPLEQVPIDSVTNGVHLPTWVGPEMSQLFDRYVGLRWRDDPTRSGEWAALVRAPDGELWAARERQRGELVARARAQHRESAARRGLSAIEGETGEVLEPGVLTIGFARRFAGYKRATLLFRDPARLARLVNNPSRPIQFIFAGKAHPRDEPAKQLIREVVAHSREPQFRGRLVVLERYDVELARALVQGCDAWLNTPLRPLEASGTSGMKAVANGSLHISVLDGWWAEAYQPGLGWQVGRERVEDDPEVQDAFDAESLYNLLEYEIGPLFYERDADGLPAQWLERVKASISAFAPAFTTQRMVGEYARRAYGPAAAAWARLRADGGLGARELSAWLKQVREWWPGVEVQEVSDDLAPGAPLQWPVRVVALVEPGRLSPADIDVTLVYGDVTPAGELEGEWVAPMTYESRGSDGLCRYSATFAPDVSGRVGYAVRILPRHPGLRDPLDLGLVHWA